jgi:hypothetical protein
LTSVVLAQGGKPGSSVILCTDGLANYGLGAMDHEEDLLSAKEFY